MKITAKYLTKVYKNGTYALNGFSAEIEEGEFVAVLGASGCGKTTLLRLLSGLDKPTAGELYFDGVLFADLPVLKRDTALVFQEYVLYPNMTVWENVATALQRYKLPREEEEKRIYDALCYLDLIRYRSQLPRVLSGGQQQRVALARTLVRSPKLLLFDEPLSNVAEEQRAEYMRLISLLKEKLPHSTFIYVTHNPREAMAMGQKLLIMGEGRCLQYGNKKRVWKYPYCADVLRSICAQTEEITGKIQGGEFVGDDGQRLNFSTDYEGVATVIFNPYNSNAPHIFDSFGNSLTGERCITFFNGEYDGQNLKFANVTYSVDDDFKLRFIGKQGKVDVGIESAKLRFSPLYGDLKIPAVKDNGKIVVCGNEICLYNADDFSKELFVNPADIELYSGGKRVLAHYRVYKQSCSGKADGTKIKLPCGKMAFKSSVRGTVAVSFDEKAYITPDKKGGVKVKCLAEDDLGGVKLVYCAVKGFGNYVTFYSKPENNFLSAQKIKISIASDGVKVVKSLR